MANDLLKILSEVLSPFQPASKEDLGNRLAVSRREYVLDHLRVSKSRQCAICAGPTGAKEFYLSVSYKGSWGIKDKAICTHCVKIAAEELRRK